MSKLFNILISLIASIFMKIIKRYLTEKIAKIRIIRKFLVNIKAVISCHDVSVVSLFAGKFVE
ncbi:hypothetical protein [Pseudanabaena sp. lw0831]|uniref:hypothetical protein n=1 Tax=Pseudanabaena sp. lw0831 TaxID=1357935 RepID=UPI0019154AF1|nr:hypothetical protein [Pseudanabaena sp. lw0831]